MDKKIGLTDTTFRDGQQSLLATRLRTEDMLPILGKMDRLGFHSMEVWGGATFDTCLRFLNEDPWDRLDKIRQTVTKTKLQMLLRGQNLLGYKPFADDVVTEFVKKAAAHGIDIFRIFDSLNDIRNMHRAVDAAKREGCHVQAAVCYTASPVHDLDYFLRLAKDFVEMGADSICIKDMAGILTPYTAFDFVRVIKENLRVPVQIHSHCTSGMAPMMYLKAIEAGADVVDTAVSTLAMGTSQPAAETLIAVLAGTAYDPGLSLSDLAEVAEYLKQIRKKYQEHELGLTSVDPNVLLYQIPGGMMSNFVSQLKQQKALDRLPLVLAEIPQVRADLGYPPLVTPTSQIVGSQAVLNVLLGRYKMVTNELRAYMLGQYGAAPGPVNEEVRRKVIRNREPIHDRPADHLAPQLEQARRELGPAMRREEDVLSFLMFPTETTHFLSKQYATASLS